MSEQSASQLNVEIALRRQEKFETYLVGLVFTLLALSVQTASFGVSLAADVLELLSWVLLFVAGLAGLSRMEWIPELYRLASYRVEKEERVRSVKTAMLHGSREVLVVPTGKTVPASEYAARDADAVAKIAAREKELEKVQLGKYRILKWCFAGALAFLIVGRGWLPLLGVVERVRAVLAP